MTEGIQKPNCGNCTKEHTYECPIDLHKSHGNSDIFDGIRRVTSNCPMACHPDARAYLMADVIKGLKKAKSENRINVSVWCNGYDEALKLAIALIRDGVK